MNGHSRNRNPALPQGSSPNREPSPLHVNGQRTRLPDPGGFAGFRRPPENSASSPPRAMPDTGSYNGFYQAPSYSQPMHQYTADYTQNGRQPQGSAYNQSVIYNVLQTGTQSAVYGTSQPYSSRQAAGMQMMPAPVVSGHYYQGQLPSAAVPAHLQTQSSPSSTSAVYQQAHPDQRLFQQTYPRNMNSMSTNGQGDGSISRMAEGQPPDVFGEAYRQYQETLGQIFTDIQGGRLRRACDALQDITNWLLTRVEELGLASDEEGFEQERMELWNDFNHAWLALLQKQKEFHLSQNPDQPQQELLTKLKLESLGSQITSLCDPLESLGLVDYGYGVWEERIIDTILECLQLYSDPPENDASPQVKSPSSGNSQSLGISSSPGKSYPEYQSGDEATGST
ncbi:hypothetical protein GGS20DRAFT_585166 [Poronia punctata]|nr:hypothetical protein GGS20DRAFT_585166 [Poronia punctata]